MKIITDHKTLSRKFTEIETELYEAEKSLERLLGCAKKNYSSLASKYNESPVSLRKDLFPFKKTEKRLRDSSESAEENASDDELPPKKTALRSAVITKIGGIASRRDVILKQNCNIKVQSRNRRMFGMVQSTLQKFRDEAVKRQSQDLKKIKIEEKVEAAEEEEWQSMQKQKLELYSKQKEKQLELECLKEMMELTEPFEVWEKNQKNLLNYNITETKPKICFLPASHTPNSKKHLKRSIIKIQDVMQNEKEVMEKELAEIIESYQFAIPVAENNYNALEEVYSSVVKEEFQFASW